MTQFSIFKHLSRVLLILSCMAIPAYAQDGLDSGDTAWILTSTALVLFMTIPGLSLFYAGLVRSKNVLSVLMQCFSITCLVSIIWVLYGYSLAFSDGGALHSLIGGLSMVGLAGIARDTMSGSIPETLFLMFQLTFAIITPALIVGGFAERMKFSAVLLFTLFWVTFVYFPICHWVWGGGWLGEAGLLDFAGGTVVHITAGVGALVAAMVMKQRIGFPTTPMPPHSMVLTVAGAGMLWVGWFGFNAGSAVAAGTDAGMAMLVTHISAAAASLTWAGIEWLKHGKPTVLGIVTGMVAGLGTITPASGFVGPMAALVLGILAGAICYTATQFIKRMLKIDDSLDVFPVHGVGGLLGTVLAGVFVASQYGGAGLAAGVTISDQVMVQIMGVVAVIVWTAIVSFIVLKVVNAMVGLRVDEDEEVEGLDVRQYDQKGYHS
ncbi:MAG: ammonium transporter [Chromatiales bacterium]|nr:ammonium transporter [Chromatiales bacterium]